MVEWGNETKTWAGIFSLTAVVGCSGAHNVSLDGPGVGAQSTDAQCGVAGEPCCGAASCDAGPACVGVGCVDPTADGTPTVAAPLDDGGDVVADATMGAPAPEGGGESVAEGAIDDTMGEPRGDDASHIGVTVEAGGSTDGSASDSGPVADARNGDAQASDAHAGGLDGGDAAAQGGSIDVGLVAIYHFDETSGATSADSSGNGNAATMQGGATFSPGVRGNAATFSGASQYVTLPTGIVTTLTDFSISAWVYQSAAGHGHRLFDFGTGTTVNMFITTDGDLLRYAVTTGGHDAEQNLLTSGILPVSSWQHLTVTQAAAVGTLYRNGAVVVQNAAMTLHPSGLGVTTQNWIGRSQYVANPYLTGMVDEFRIYKRALSAAEVMDLYVQKR